MKDIPNNEIWYTAKSRSIIKNFDVNAFNSQLLSNTYKKGIGVLQFSTDLTIIGESAFFLCEELESIILPNSLKRIEAGAFSACENLKKINIPENVQEIGECAFGLCVSLECFSGKFASTDGCCLVIDGILNQFALGCGLKEYFIPNDVYEIGWSSFSESELDKIFLHNKIIKIHHSAFCGCRKLREINIPNSVTTIDDAAFQDCMSLKNISIPKSVKSLGFQVFEGCDDILIVYEDKNQRSKNDRNLTQFIADYVPLQDKLSNGWVYLGNKDAKTIYIPEGVTLVKSNAFENCYKIEKIYVPNSVEEIEDGVFAHLDKLCCFESEFASEDERCLILKNTLVGFASDGLDKYTIPTEVTNIAPKVFCNKDKIRTIVFQEGVRLIGNSAFLGCYRLSDVQFPSTLKCIGSFAFAGCVSLKSIIVPNSVKAIGESAFADCKQLVEIVLPEELVSINENIFTGCYNLTRIKSQLTSKNGNSLIIGDTLVHYVGQQAMTEFVVPNNVKTIAKNAFLGNNNIKKIIIPESVTKIGAGAFHGCRNLLIVEFESRIPPKIESSTFYDNARRFMTKVPKGTESTYRKAFKAVGLDILVIDKANKEVFHEIIYGNSYDNEISLEKLLSIGIGCYHDGDEKGAISVFEKMIARDCKEDYPYRALAEIYKKHKDVNNEIRILSHIIKKIPNKVRCHEYKLRLGKLSNERQNNQFPSVVVIPQPRIKHGDLYEQELFKLPEFNFYKGPSTVMSMGFYERRALLKPMGEIIDYFNELLHNAEIAESQKDYITASSIYETIVAERYWSPYPYDRLIKIYSRAKLLNEEIRVLKFSIEHFTKLKEKRYKYIMQLADKYDAYDYIEHRNAKTHGRIAYFIGWHGDIQLYEPFPIINVWKERLEKKLK